MVDEIDLGEGFGLMSLEDIKKGMMLSVITAKRHQTWPERKSPSIRKPRSCRQRLAQ